MTEQIWSSVSDAQLKKIHWAADITCAKEHFARLAIACFTEADDRVAGTIIDRLGAEHALEHIVSRTDPLLLAKLSFGETKDTARLANKIFEAQQRWNLRVSLQLVDTALDALETFRAQTVLPSETSYSRGLADLGSGKPIVLFVMGRNPVATFQQSTAIIGARNSSDYGERCVREFLPVATEAGQTVISGGAVGIDSLAHKSAIAAGGQTIAYLAGGFDYMYPPENKQLFEEIMLTGALFTESPPGSKPTKWRFLKRNRLIAASCKSILIVEAAWRSGTINTAQNALDLGRNVGVVPGDIFKSASHGIYRLAKNPDVQLIADKSDFRALLGIGELGAISHDDLPIGENCQRVLDALGSGKKSVKVVAAEVGLGELEVEIALNTLETLGKSARFRDGWRLSHRLKTNL